MSHRTILLTAGLFLYGCDAGQLSSDTETTFGVDNKESAILVSNVGPTGRSVADFFYVREGDTVSRYERHSSTPSGSVRTSDLRGRMSGTPYGSRTQSVLRLLAEGAGQERVLYYPPHSAGESNEMAQVAEALRPFFRSPTIKELDESAPLYDVVFRASTPWSQTQHANTRWKTSHSTHYDGRAEGKEPLATVLGDACRDCLKWRAVGLGKHPDLGPCLLERARIGEHWPDRELLLFTDSVNVTCPGLSVPSEATVFLSDDPAL